MAKDLKDVVATSQNTSEDQAFEMIELSIDGLNTLAKAFDVINEVCQEFHSPQLIVDQTPPKQLLN